MLLFIHTDMTLRYLLVSLRALLTVILLSRMLSPHLLFSTISPGKPHCLLPFCIHTMLRILSL